MGVITLFLDHDRVRPTPKITLRVLSPHRQTITTNRTLIIERAKEARCPLYWERAKLDMHVGEHDTLLDLRVMFVSKYPGCSC